MISDDPRYGLEVRRRMAELSAVGDLAPAEGVAQARAGDREMGAEVVLQLRVRGARAAEIRFRAFGCPHFIAAASWLTDRMRGATRGEFANWDWHEAAVALEVPPAKYGRLLVLQDAVRALAGNWPDAAESTV